MLKGVFDIETILKSLGVDVVGLTGNGRIRAYCPMHPRREVHPRHWSMDPETGLHHCFSCGYKGNLTSLVTDLTDMDVWSALSWLRSEGLQEIIFERPKIIDEEVLAEERRELAATAEEQWAIFDDPPEKELKKRKVSLDAAHFFDVRWSRKAQTEEDREMLLRDRAWAFPLKEWDGSFLGYQLKAKRYVKNVPTGVRKDLTLFGIDKFPPGEPAVLVESPLDALLLHELGYHPLAVMGSHVSQPQLALLIGSTNRVVSALDNDDAGRTEARRLMTELRGQHLSFMEYRVASGSPKDPGEMSDGEICAAIRASALPHEAGALLGPKPFERRRVAGRAAHAKGRRRVRR